MLSRVLTNALCLVAPGVLDGKPTAIIGVGRSNRAGHEHETLRTLLAELRADVLDEQVSITAGQLADENTHQQIRALFTALAARVEAKASLLAR
jgi:NAD(P)H-dependent FMN reductase